MKEVTQFEALKAKNITNRKTKKQFTLCELLSFATNKASLALAEVEGFEPPGAFTQTVFKTASL